MADHWAVDISLPHLRCQEDRAVSKHEVILVQNLLQLPLPFIRKIVLCEVEGQEFGARGQSNLLRNLLDLVVNLLQKVLKID